MSGHSQLSFRLAHTEWKCISDEPHDVCMTICYLSKNSGSFMYRQFNVHNFFIFPTQCVCVSTNDVNQVEFVIETQYVFCSTGTHQLCLSVLIAVCSSVNTVRTGAENLARSWAGRKWLAPFTKWYCDVVMTWQSAGWAWHVASKWRTYETFMIYIYLTAVGLTPGGNSTSHNYTQTVRIIQR
jgi:hypothetical protein